MRSRPNSVGNIPNFNSSFSGALLLLHIINENPFPGQPEILLYNMRRIVCMENDLRLEDCSATRVHAR